MKDLRRAPLRRGTTRLTCLFVALLLSAATVASAQGRYQVLGPSQCLNCHDHQAERQWYEKLEIPEVRKLFPEKGANAGHINALKQLEMAKSNDFAKAIGLRDKYDVNGACVKCHATVFAGDANAGVSCESCHGPASGYLEIHKTKGAYEKSVAAGMTHLIGQLERWAQQCTSCHVMDDARLITAGHPSGDDFDLGVKYAPVAIHFKQKYDTSRLAAIGRAQVATLVSKRGGGTPTPAVAAAPLPAAPPPPAPAAPVLPPPAPVVTPAPPPVAIPAPAPAPTVAPARPVAAAPTVTAPAPVPAVVAPPEATPIPLPLPPAAAPAYTPSASVAGAMAFHDAVAYVQGRLVTALTALLQSGASAPVRSSTPARPLPPYSGPDAALLQIQREAIALALETLGTAPGDAPR